MIDDLFSRQVLSTLIICYVMVKDVEFNRLFLQGKSTKKSKLDMIEMS